MRKPLGAIYAGILAIGLLLTAACSGTPQSSAAPSSPANPGIRVGEPGRSK